MVMSINADNNVGMVIPMIAEMMIIMIIINVITMFCGYSHGPIRKVWAHSDFIISHTLEFKVPIGYQKCPTVQGLPMTYILTRELHRPIRPTNSFQSPSPWLSHALASLEVTVFNIINEN